MAKAKRRKKGAARKSTKKTKKVRRGRRPGARRGGRPAAAPASAMTQALRGLEAYRGELVAAREQLDQQLDAVDNALREMGKAPARPAGRPAGRGRGRPAAAPAGRAGGYRPGSLKDHIEQVLAANGEMAVKDITDAVVATGYKSKNKTLAKSVGIALTEMPNVVKVRRGQFRLG